MLQDRFGLRLRHHRRERRDIRLLHRLQAAEMFQQSARGAFADAGDFAQFSGAVADLAALAMESYGEAVGFVADELDQMQDRRVMVEDDRFAFLSVDVDDFFALGDRGQRLVDDLRGSSALRRRR